MIPLIQIYFETEILISFSGELSFSPIPHLSVLINFLRDDECEANKRESELR